MSVTRFGCTAVHVLQYVEEEFPKLLRQFPSHFEFHHWYNATCPYAHKALDDDDPATTLLLLCTSTRTYVEKTTRNALCIMQSLFFFIHFFSLIMMSPLLVTHH